MANIRQLKSGRFNAQYRPYKQPAKSATFDTKEEAEAWINSFECSINQEPDIGPLFFNIGMGYCDTVLKGRASYLLTVKRINKLSKILPKHISNIDKRHINSYRLDRLKQVSGVTVRDELQLINRIYRWAYRELILEETEYPNPCKYIPIPPPSKPRNKVITEKELKQLLNALPFAMRPIIELAYETAMRRTEILKLTLRHLNLEERYLEVIDGKTGDRVVPLTLRAVELLSESIKDIRGDDVRLFPIEPHSVTTAVRRARRKAGLDEDIRMHQLRHTRISMVARKGFNQAQIMMVSGHRDSRSVQRYTHLSVKDIVKIID